MLRKIGTYGCDAGSLKIGGKDFSVLIENGYGDGEFDVYVCDGRDVPSYARFAGCFQGRNLRVFDYDCDGGKPIDDVYLTGSFIAHNFNGNMYLERLDNDTTYWGNNV